MLVVGRSDSSGSKHEGLTMVSVPTDAEGIEINGIQTMGGKEVNDVFLTDCYVTPTASSARRAAAGCS